MVFLRESIAANSHEGKFLFRPEQNIAYASGSDWPILVIESPWSCVPVYGGAMSDSPQTRASLLVRIRDSHDAQAWRQFVDLYAPLIYGFARKHGLQDADAADLTQEVLGIVAGSIRQLEYDPQRGAFRGWLFTIVRNRLRNFLARRRPYEQGSGDSGVHNLLQELPDSADGPDAAWESEYQRQLFSCAAKYVRARVHDWTWQAFWQTAVEGRSASEVAERLNRKVSAVYLAKSRLMAQLKDYIRQLQDE
jgi:RNA polymerase sigma factor (sigma-70 family)